MSLMKSLARVAAGIMLAKGVGAMMKKSQQSRTAGGTPPAGHQGSGGILDEIIGGSAGSRQAGASGGGLGDILGQVLGGRAPGAGGGSAYGGAHSPSGRATGGLGGILDDLTAGRGGGTSTAGGSGGGLGDLGKILTGGAAAGGLGGILGDLLGGGQAQAGGLAQKGSQPQSDASFGEVLNDALVHGGEPKIAPTPEQNAVAGLILKAMIQAAKSDGKIDEAEQARLTKEFGELDDEDRAFIRAQMAAPVDPAALAREVPQGLGPQIYLMSLMSIDFDNRNEAQYLHALATELGLDKEAVNAIHKKVGTTSLYA